MKLLNAMQPLSCECTLVKESRNQPMEPKMLNFTDRTPKDDYIQSVMAA